jgi:ribosomal protein L3 glutamine methyltransferase
MTRTAADWVEQCAAEMQDAGLVFGHGTDNALDEAAWLVLHALGAPMDGGFDDWGRELSAVERGRVQDLLARRIGERIPLAYLTGEARFCGLDFIVTPDVLVPRSPIAELIRGSFSPWVRLGPGCRVLDLCTGGGCIAVAMARHMPGIRVDAVDISGAALEIAARNVERHGVQAQVRLVRSDLFSALEGQRYDLVVSNPPYVSAQDFADLPPEYLAEPSGGLVAGRDGLDIVLKILDASPAYLAAQGVLVVEVGESAPALTGLLPRVPFLWLEFEQGGDGVFLLEYDQLVACREDLRSVLERREDVG